jgi:hypothetical protein
MPYKDPIKRRECANRIAREWAKKNRERTREIGREWYHRNKAKAAARHKDWLARNPDYRRNYRSANKEKIATAIRNWQIENWGKVLAAARRARIKRPEEIVARNALNGAIRSGKIIKPECCSKCGATARIHGHHHLGYEKKHHFSVTWLCVQCHENVHHL